MKRFVLLLLAALLSPAWAQACTVPYTFSSGSTASSSQVNGNFSALVNCLSPALAPPEGRLTLITGVPIMASDVTGATTVYFTPYLGNTVPLYSGTSFVANTFAQTAVTLDTTNVTAGKIYDLFLFSNSGTVQLGYGPSWTSNTTRAAAITQLNGLWVNSASITLRWSSSNTATVAASQALYVGSFYAIAAGQTAMQMQPAAASGGSNAVLGLWNAYNRVLVSSNSDDSTGTWSYALATYRFANGSSSNRIRYVDGLAQSRVFGRYGDTLVGGAGMNPTVGLERDWSSGTPSGRVAVGAAGLEIAPIAENSWAPALGLHEIDALESNNGTTASTFVGAAGSLGQCMNLTIQLEM